MFLQSILKNSFFLSLVSSLSVTPSFNSSPGHNLIQYLRHQPDILEQVIKPLVFSEFYNQEKCVIYIKKVAISIKIWLNNWWRLHMCNVHNMLPWKKELSSFNSLFFCRLIIHSRFSTAVLLGELCQFGPFIWKSLKTLFVKCAKKKHKNG